MDWINLAHSTWDNFILWFCILLRVKSNSIILATSRNHFSLKSRSLVILCLNTWCWPACRPKHVVWYYKGILTLKKSGCDWWLKWLTWDKSSGRLIVLAEQLTQSKGSVNYMETFCPLLCISLTWMDFIRRRVGSVYWLIFSRRPSHQR
jgi:hypothetical protein